jgi:hypothetical protein
MNDFNTPKVVPHNNEVISNHDSSHSDKWSSFRFSPQNSSKHNCVAKMCSMKTLYLTVLLIFVAISTIAMGVAHQVNLNTYSTSLSGYQGAYDKSVVNNLQFFVQNVRKTVELSNFYYTTDQLDTLSMQRYIWSQLKNLNNFNVQTVILSSEQTPNFIGYTKFGGVLHMLRNWKYIDNLVSEIGMFPIDLKTGLNITSIPIASVPATKFLNLYTKMKNNNSPGPFLDVQSENFSIHFKLHLHSFVGIVSVSFSKEVLSSTFGNHFIM